MGAGFATAEATLTGGELIGDGTAGWQAPTNSHDLRQRLRAAVGNAKAATNLAGERVANLGVARDGLCGARGWVRPQRVCGPFSL